MPTSPTPIDAITTVPSIASPATFENDTNTFINALPDFQDQANDLGANVYSNALEATTAATNAQTAEANAETAEAAAEAAQLAAATSASQAAASALTAVNAPGTNGTSSTSLTIGAGSKSFATQTGKAWVVGQPVTIARTADPVNTRMWGTIGAYDSGMGLMGVTVGAGQFTGSGTYSDWTISLAGNTTAAALAGTATNAINWAATVTIASAATVNIGAAASNDLIISGTTTITAFDSIAAGASRKVKFTGALTLTHNATSLILPGGANITTADGDTAQFTSLGSGNWKCDWYSKANGQAVAGGVPALVLLATASASSVATVDFTSLIDSTYDEYEVHLQNVRGASASDLRMRVSTNGGSSFDSSSIYTLASIFTSNVSAGPNAISNVSYAQFDISAQDNVSNTAANGGATGVIRFAQPSSGTIHKHFLWELLYATATPGAGRVAAAGTWQSTTAINALRFYFGSGNIASGLFKLYGVSRSV